MTAPLVLVSAPFPRLTCPLDLHRDLFDAACLASLPTRDFDLQCVVLESLESLRVELDARESPARS